MNKQAVLLTENSGVEEIRSESLRILENIFTDYL